MYVPFTKKRMGNAKPVTEKGTSCLRRSAWSVSLLVGRVINEQIIITNRAPVLTLWCFVVARLQGFSSDVSLKAARVITSRLAHIKAKRLGISVDRQSLPNKRNNEYGDSRTSSKKCIAGFSVSLESMEKVSASIVRMYLTKNFGKSLKLLTNKLRTLAKAVPNIGTQAYNIYEVIRPDVAPGIHGWGQKGILDIKIIERLTRHFKTIKRTKYKI